MVSLSNHNSARPTDPHPIPPITEKQLAHLWQRRAARHRAFHTETGARVRVLYPGRPGVTAGPDFRNALLMVEGQGLVQGDVEVHLRQQDWQSHGHHRDPNYNGVVLHVALESHPQPSRTDGGGSPPLVNLTDLLTDPPAGDDHGDAVRSQLWQSLAQHGYRRPERAEQMAALLNRAGDARFLSHSSRLGMLMSAQPPEQTLWESICDALGYRHNRHPFLMLATAAPCAVLSASARQLPESQRETALTLWLLRLAGFESGPVPAGLGPPLDSTAWRLFRVRPPNHPRRRIPGAAALLARFCASGLAAGLSAAASAGDAKALTRMLTVAAGDGQPAPSQPAPSEPSRGEPPPIGTARAQDIAVNAVLPFLHAHRTLAGDYSGAERMLELYRRYGPLSDNEITRELAAALQEPAWGRVANNARRQQGLIHLQRLLAGATPPPISEAPPAKPAAPRRYCG